MLLVDAVPLSGGVPLRLFLGDVIGTVEAAEGRPIDLVDYGKGPALVAARLASSPRPIGPVGGMWCVVASSGDKLTDAVLPVLVRLGWLVVRGVR